MDASSRRSYLIAVVERAETDTVRLKALELIDRLDAREGAKLPTSEELSEQAAQRLADDPERLAKFADLHIEHGLFDPFPAFQELVERRAEAIVEERAQAARESFHVAAKEPEAVEEVGSLAPELEAASEPEDAPERPDPLSPEVLARQWAQRRRGLRDVQEHTILRQDDRD